MSEVLIEVLPNIHVCNMYITLPEKAGSCSNILVKKSECIIQYQSGQEMCLKMPKTTCLVPDVVRNVDQVADLVTARVELDERTSLISTLAGDLLSDPDFLTSEPLSSTLSNTALLAYCKQCKQQVFNNVNFQRILPLPSVDWEHASEDWFCHIHTEDGQKLKPTSLQPQQGECFYTELFFQVHSSLLECMGVETDSKDITCHKCKSSLGVFLQNSLKIWTHNLVWVKECGEIVHSVDVNSIMLTLFQNIEKDNFGVNCRLVLQLQTVPKKYLYLVTMNTNQKMLISENSELFSAKKIEWKGTYQEEISEGEAVALKRARMSDSKEIRLRVVYGVKLLYGEKEGEDAETGEWADNVHVHLIPCSESFFTQVKDNLQATTNCLPEYIRTVKNMKVGYIIK